MKLIRVTSYSLAVVALALAFHVAGVAAVSPLQAQSGVPTEDSACRNCHSDSSQEYIFPSGDAVGVGIDLARLDASPHSAYGDTAVYCTSCHARTSSQYRYPHAVNPANSPHEFSVAVSMNCEQCHYPHKPFHPIEGSDTSTLDGILPGCADCHGSHDIARVEAMPDTMPDRCLACHTDQDAQWAADFLEPRAGLGAGAEGFVGSTRCNGCHDNTYYRWRETYHAKFIQDARSHPDAVLGDFEALDSDVVYTKQDVSYTIGNRWRQAYLVGAPTIASTGTVTSSMTLLPLQWSIAEEEWIPLTEGGAPPQDWITECGSCHVTGLDTSTWEFTEFGVGCEACHGPAADHAADPENVKPYAEADDQVCGQCHSRGLSSEGYHFPLTYRPGDLLSDHFTFTTSDEDVWPDGSAKRNHQQYMDWQLGSSMSLSDEVQCVSCHAVHDPGQAHGQLRAPLNDLCVQCHGQQEALARHTPFHQSALQERTFECTDCHMPLMAISAEPFDLHNHSFLQPDPQGTIEHGGLENMPNACNQCHQGVSESPEWAAQTIAHARTLMPEASFFGPGPTPTSPPPPTPMPSVGQVAKLEVTPPLWWLRWAAILLAVAIAGYIVVWIALTVRSRRSTDG